MLRSDQSIYEPSTATGGWGKLTVTADISDCGNLVGLIRISRAPFLMSIGGNVTNDGAEIILLKLSQTLS